MGRLSYGTPLYHLCIDCNKLPPGKAGFFQEGSGAVLLDALLFRPAVFVFSSPFTPHKSQPGVFDFDVIPFFLQRRA